MFHSATRRASTMIALTASLVIAGAIAISAQSIDQETFTHVIGGVGGSRVAMSPAGSTANMRPTAEAATALQGVEANKDGTPNKKVLVGSWLETVWFPPETGRPPLKSLSSFHDDETMVCSDQGNVTTEPPTVFSACHGVWTHLEKRRFAYTAFELISDLSGNLVGYLKVRGIYTLSQSGNEYNGTSFAEVLDTGGNVIFSVNVTNAGKRIQVELP